MEFTNRPGPLRDAVLRAHAMPWGAGWGALLAMLAVVVTWMAVVPPTGNAVFAIPDVLLHGTAFAALAVPAGLMATSAGSRGAAWAALGLLAYGVVIEVVQSMLPYRSAEWSDLLADAAGIAAGLSVVAAARAWATEPPAGRR
jgi:VanZ family protein